MKWRVLYSENAENSRQQQPVMLIFARADAHYSGRERDIQASEDHGWHCEKVVVFRRGRSVEQMVFCVLMQPVITSFPLSDRDISKEHFSTMGAFLRRPRAVRHVSNISFRNVFPMVRKMAGFLIRA